MSFRRNSPAAASRSLFAQVDKTRYTIVMPKSGGLLIGCGGSKRSQKIAQAIELNQQFTAVFDTTELSIPQAELALVSLEGETIDFVGLVRPGRRVATGQKTLSVSYLIPVGIEGKSLLRSLAPKFASRINLGIDGVDRLPPGTWEALLNTIRSQGDQAVAAIRQTTDRVTHIRTLRRGSGEDLEEFERDAVATALEAWGGTRERKRVLRSTALPTDETAPFLSRLSSVSLREDPQIIHDAETLPGMTVARRYQIGIAVLENRQDRLTIINCNRQRLEETLGVDLVYYNHRFRSFVMVQYKRMKQAESGKHAYRPKSDASYKSELARMISVNKELQSVQGTKESGVNEFRLFRAPFFFKLCADRAKSALEEGMVSGMYVPLGLWRKLLKSTEVIGSRGGRVVTWENCTRRFNNSEFTSLLSHGWIGSSAAQSDSLGNIIEASLSAKKMIVYAATSRSTSKGDYLRDDVGRFAPDDDPLAVR